MFRTPGTRSGCPTRGYLVTRKPGPEVRRGMSPEIGLSELDAEPSLRTAPNGNSLGRGVTRLSCPRTHRAPPRPRTPTTCRACTRHNKNKLLALRCPLFPGSREPGPQDAGISFSVPVGPSTPRWVPIRLPSRKRSHDRRQIQIAHLSPTPPAQCRRLSAGSRLAGATTTTTTGLAPIPKMVTGPRLQGTGLGEGASPRLLQRPPREVGPPPTVASISTEFALPRRACKYTYKIQKPRRVAKSRFDTWFPPRLK